MQNNEWDSMSIVVAKDVMTEQEIKNTQESTHQE